MLGVNVGCSIYRSGGLSAAWLDARMSQHLGASLLGSWSIDAAALNASGQIASVPSKQGVTLADISGNGTLLNTVVINGRRFSVASAESVAALGCNLGVAFKVAICVCVSAATPAGYALGSGAGAENILLPAVPPTTWHSNTGWTHSRNGVATQDISANVAVYVATDATSSATNLRVAGLGAGFASFNFRGSIGYVAAVSSALTAPVLASVVADLGRYYRI